MARVGLGEDWHCLFANDCDKLKQLTYTQNWEGDRYDLRDVAEISATDLGDLVDLAWASFPCQDLSQAGSKAGIGCENSPMATRSGAVWPFLNIIRALAEQGRHPVLLALENVLGLISSNSGTDFRSICATLGEIGYRFGAIIVDAAYFVPQSRPRVFIVAIRREVPIPTSLRSEMPHEPWHTQTLLRAKEALPREINRDWVWWAPGTPPMNESIPLSSVINVGDEADWNNEELTTRLISMMNHSNLARLSDAKTAARNTIGSLYLRMRPTSNGGNVQRTEIAFGPTLGCIRTPKGGASRPRIIVVDGERVRTRLLSVREAALLMGLPEGFKLPDTYNAAFRQLGDGVVTDVVRFISDRLLKPLAIHSKSLIVTTTDKVVMT